MVRFAGQDWSAAEWASLEAQRAEGEARMTAEMGEEWMEAHRRMLDSQWEYVVSLGLAFP